MWLTGHADIERPTDDRSPSQRDDCRKAVESADEKQAGTGGAEEAEDGGAEGELAHRRPLST